MAFTYDFDSLPAIAFVRLLVADTDSAKPIFDDSEITAATAIQAMQYGGSGPVSYLRVAALLLDAQAAQLSRRTTTKLLDANQDPIAAAKGLREQAQRYREVDDASVALIVIENCRVHSDLRRICEANFL